MDNDRGVLMICRNLTRVALFAPAAALCAPVLAVAGADNARIGFSIRQQPVGSALARFSEQSGLRVLFPYDRVNGLSTRGVSGRMAPRAALEKLLQGTPLHIAMARDGVVALSVEQAPASRLDSPPAASPVHLVSLSMAQSQTSDAPPPAPSVAAPARAAADSENPASEIVVTGSRGLPRTVTESPTPIDVISASDIGRTGRPGGRASSRR
jgi:iron complex outermembrane receptor protein